MYQGFSKENGDIIGIIGNGVSLNVDIEDAAETTSADEALVCQDINTGENIVLSAIISPNSGEIVWVNKNKDFMMKKTVGMSQMTSMLHDEDRNNLYNKAIEVLIKNFVQVMERAPVMLDIGTGTGLLAMMCAENGADFVIGIEMFDEMASIAQQVINANDYDEQIMIINARSTEVESLPVEPDMLVSELIDSSLLGESCIPTHTDAINRLLSSTTLNQISVENLIIPHSATNFATLIESFEIFNMHGIDNFSSNGCYNINPWRNGYPKGCDGDINTIPLHWNALKSRGAQEMSTATELINFDFFRCYDTSSEVIHTEVVTLEASKSGIIHGVLLWWKLYLLSPDLDPNRALFYSSEPCAMNWQDHWQQTVFPLKEPIACSGGDKIQITASYDAIKIWLQVEKLCNEDKNILSKRKMTDEPLPLQTLIPCICGWHMLNNPERIQMMNNPIHKQVWNKTIDAISYKLFNKFQTKKSNLLAKNIILDVSDGSLISISLANKIKSLFPNLSNFELQTIFNVVSKENKLFSRMFYEQIADANDLTGIFLSWDGEDISDISTICCSTDENDDEMEDEQMNITNNNPETFKKSVEIMLLICECYFYQLSTQPILEAISFFYQRHRLAPFLSENVIVVPQRAYVMIAALELKHLHVSHGKVGSVAGFDHSPLDEYQEDWYNNIFPYKLSQYEKKFLTKPTQVGYLDYVNGHISPSLNLSEFQYLPIIATNAKCHCVAIWIDYQLCEDDATNQMIILSNCHPLNNHNTDSHSKLETNANDYSETNIFEFTTEMRCSCKFFPREITVNSNSSLQYKLHFEHGLSNITTEFMII
eukprot:gene5693-7859_t